MGKNDEFTEDLEVRYVCGHRHNPDYYERFRNGEVEENCKKKPRRDFNK
jgi:hypothetical protein